MKAKASIKPTRGKSFLIITGGAAAAGFMLLAASLFAGPGSWQPLEYSAIPLLSDVAPSVPSLPVFQVTHLPTPTPVKALYMTSWVAGTARLRDRLIKLVDETELNAMVIDIKDYTGRIAFLTDDPVLNGSGAVEERIKDIKGFVHGLHEKNIYVIGRVSVFQDGYFVKQHPEFAVHRYSDGGIWKDRKGISWLEVGATAVWDYTVRIARAARAVGFDEINFDYIRFPSDGDMKDISYRHFNPAAETRAATLKQFYAYLSRELAPLGLPISADLFGLVTTAEDDLGIGQVLIDAAPYFDYIAPMVYPSHFASGFLNFSNPAAYPYEVVKHSMLSASGRLAAASSTPVRLRPWLQDFDLGADYTAAMVRAQIQATYDAGLSSWMLWDPSNRYTEAALDKFVPN